MKIIQSFWSKPSLHSDTLLVDARFNGGWPHRMVNYYSWAFSCLQLCKLYKEVELVTDDIGKEILVDKMRLPYTNISLALNDIDSYNHGLWTFGKVCAYGSQNGPFLHVDHDVFLWKELEQHVAGAALAAQHLELKGQPYSNMFLHICDTFRNVPSYFRPLYDMGFSPSWNTGVFGGNNIPFIQSYCAEVYSFLNRNKADVERAVKMNAGEFSVVIEQVILYAYAKHLGEDVNCLFPPCDSVPDEIGYFPLSGEDKDFVHCIGGYKKDRISYSFLEWKLKEYYPEYFERINYLVADSEI